MCSVLTLDTRSSSSHAATRLAEARAAYEGLTGVSKLSKLELFEERAKKLNERFGLEIQPMEWQKAIPNDTVLRMDKPIRMRILKRPSKTGGHDLVHKKPRQRVRLTCHECNTLFIAGTKVCERCSHVRCTDCPRDP